MSPLFTAATPSHVFQLLSLCSTAASLFLNILCHYLSIYSSFKKHVAKLIYIFALTQRGLICLLVSWLNTYFCVGARFSRATLTTREPRRTPSSPPYTLASSGSSPGRGTGGSPWGWSCLFAGAMNESILFVFRINKDFEQWFVSGRLLAFIDCELFVCHFIVNFCITKRVVEHAYSKRILDLVIVGLLATALHSHLWTELHLLWYVNDSGSQNCGWH